MMSAYGVTAIVVGVIVSFLIRRRFASAIFRSDLDFIIRGGRGFLSARSDWARERFARCLAVSMLRFNALNFGYLALCVGLIAAVPVSRGASPSEWRHYLLTTSIAPFGVWALRAVVARSAFYKAALSKLLHRLVLDLPQVGAIAFELERTIFLRPNEHVEQNDRPVYVCGLARSGTTILLKLLDQRSEFCSLTYRSMPFVLAPNLFNIISRPGSPSAQFTERTQGDGIMVGPDSPESFEEVFWRTFSKRLPVSVGYGFEPISAETITYFRDYRQLVARHCKLLPPNCSMPRYLSKNNNNIIRLAELCESLGATVLLVYRHPAATAHSLFNQHLRFRALQYEDAFGRKYMGWLGHFEFGLDHLPLAPATEVLESGLSPDTLDYWLFYWITIYNYINRLHHIPFRLCSYEAMCLQPMKFYTKLCRALDVELSTDVDASAIQNKASVVNTAAFNPALMQEALQLYKDLSQDSRNIICLSA